MKTAQRDERLPTVRLGKEGVQIRECIFDESEGQVDFRQRKEAFYWKKVRKAGKTKNRENNLILQI